MRKGDASNSGIVTEQGRLCEEGYNNMRSVGLAGLVTEEDFHLVEGVGFAMTGEAVVVMVGGATVEGTSIPDLNLESEVVVGEPLQIEEVTLGTKGVDHIGSSRWFRKP
ncbi:Nuclear transport factor 2 (NTF2) domain [Musa troglodytarum]|uniref:Nuclear transport factor 2 (NTF2) domain n=1 Tax=Musa troglodytarum TaxID=320322 RepID=A0A9E7GZU4_9LILI|nr:Nuclear transport factor 2 (NTF2) domain [Musa troglodytarum]